jgi:serine/threonine protein kinase/predicted ATPase
MSRLALFLLGPPRIECNGEPIEVRRRKAMALIVYLAVTGRSHSRDALATLFWPEHDQSRARAGLRRALAALKKALRQVHPERSRRAQDAAPGEGWLDVDQEAVGLNRDAELWLDVDEFQDRLAECETHGHPQDQVCPACLPLLAEAAALYRDHFLAGFTLRDSPGFDEWQFFQAEGLRDELASALERLARGHSDRGEFERAIAYARRWLALDPLHEPAHRCLMRLYAWSGQRAAALRQYGECERVLQEELGVVPEEETAQVYQAIKEHRERTVADSQPERYRLERKISSKGSFGEVWLATDTLLDRLVAIKCPKVAHDPIRRERFLAEARMLARLNHPNITQIYDALFDEGANRFYLVMEYVDGKDLAEIIRAGTPLPLDWVLDVAMGVLRALSYAHGQGVVHRDVKPANVMIADDVKLTDFGLENLQLILQEGTSFMAGTAAYMAPEQIEGRAVDGRADLYSLGVMLFEMITGGRLPFDHADRDEMLKAHLNVVPIPLSTFAPTIPPVLEQVIMRLLAKDPEDRYPSAEAVMDVLDSIHVGPKSSNLPIPLTPFIGREVELAEIADRLGDPACRLLTLVGPGGSGKTRLALEAAAAQVDNFAHGVFYVPLAPLDSAEAIVPTVAEALNFSFHKESEPQQQLLDYLRQKSTLLILDNFEHLLDGVGLVTDILRTAPDVKILAASRTRLYVQGEHLFPIVGMEFPGIAVFRETAEDAAQYSAVKLFLSSARRVQPDFEPTDDDLMDVAQICRLVQGMPLAILLAAPWVGMLSPAEIAAEISQGLDFLETDLRDVPARQRSMRAVFDHSWNLLTERERAMMQALSVFRGGFSREAAQHVTAASLRELKALVDKSLLQPMSKGRHGMHDLLRGYAAERLETSGDADAVRDTHSAYYAEFLHQREADLKGRRQLGALDEIEADFENMRAAWNWALKQKNYTAISQSLRSLGWFCEFRSRNQEREELFRRAREQLAPGPNDEPHPVWGRILVAEFYARPYEVDSAQIEGGLAIAQKHGDLEAIAVGVLTLGKVALDADDYAGALSFYEESLAISRDLDDSFHIAAALYRLAETYRLLGQPDKAITFALQSLDLSREIGDRFWAASSLADTGVIALYTGNYTEAEGYLRKANTIYREMGYRAGIASSNVVLGKLAFLKADFEKANALAEEALEIATDIGSKRVAQSARYLTGLVATTLGEKKDEHPDEEEPAPITDIPTKIDQYEVKRLLSAGDFGAVYLAHDPDSGRDVAIKVANPEHLKKYGWALKAFKRESVIMAKLAHPAIPEFYGYGETADHVYIVLEFIKGKDLLAMLEEQEGFLPEKEVIEWAIQVCDGLIHLHSQRPAPLIFRDVKPSNMMIDPYGQVYLIDFGISVTYQPGREQAAIGTEGYSPPEQYLGYTDARSDVYALGATLHHLLTRRDPRKEKPFSFHNAPPHSLNPAISEELEAVILKAVEHNPEDRYQSVKDMKTALLACL